MTKATWRDAWSIRSRIASSVTSAMTVRLKGFPGRFAQRETGLLGSASMIVTLAPCPASSVARTTAEVDFPAPPLGLAKTMVGMADETADDLLTNNKRADHRQTADRLITDRKLINGSQTPGRAPARRS